MMETKQDFTTIQISKEVHLLLESKKIYKRETFNEVIERIIIENEGIKI